MLRRASASLSWPDKRGSLLSDLEDEDLQVFHEGELFHGTWGRWQSGWWRLCWTDNTRAEAVLVHYAQPLASSRLRGKNDYVLMRRIKIVVPVEKHEVSAGASIKADGMFRLAFGTVAGSSFILAAGSQPARDEWLRVIYETLITQARSGYHEDPNVVTDLQAFQEAYRQERQERGDAGRQQATDHVGQSRGGGSGSDASNVGVGNVNGNGGMDGASAHEQPPPAQDLIDFGDHDLLDLGSLSA